MQKRIKTVLAWSSGKDSAWALHALRNRSDIDVVALVSTINEVFDRVAMHAVRSQLVRLQAQSVGLPIHLIALPHPCSNAAYEARMAKFVEQAVSDGVSAMAFGDLFLEDIRQYRETQLAGTGIQPLFPLWGAPTPELARDMVAAGLRARITCIDPKCLPAEFAGREFDTAFLSDLPEAVDPCGENGEFHSFVTDGPMFSTPIPVTVGETVKRDGFVYCDLFFQGPTGP